MRRLPVLTWGSQVTQEVPVWLRSLPQTMLWFPLVRYCVFLGRLSAPCAGSAVDDTAVGQEPANPFLRCLVSVGTET